MKRKMSGLLLISTLTVTALVAGTAGFRSRSALAAPSPGQGQESQESAVSIETGSRIVQLEEGLSAVIYEVDDWFDRFLEQGGAASDSQVINFLSGQLTLGEAKPVLQTNGFGCSTLAVKSPEGESLFGRNFDWENCEALILQSYPTDSYASISTVNMDFIRSGYGGNLAGLPENIRTALALYAPLDGMNEKGLAVSVNTIQDSETGEPDLP